MLTISLLLALNGPLTASPSMDGLAAVRSVLQRTDGATRARDEVLTRRLVALGTEAMPALFSLVTGEGIESFLGETESDAWLCPPDRIGDLALEAMGDLPRLAVCEFLRGTCSASPVKEVRTAALRVLARQAAPEGLALLLDICVTSGDELELRSLRVPAVGALTSMLRADAKTMRAFEERLSTAPLLLQHLACEALAGCGRVDSLVLLSKLLGRDPALDLAAMEAMAQLGERFPWALGDKVGARLRTVLENGAIPLRAASARALGRTRDPLSVPSLIECLKRGDAGLARAAQWALCEISGQKRPSTPDEWALWFEVERTWWKDEGARLLASLESDPPTELSATLRTLLAHPIGRDRVSDALATVLPTLDSRSQIAACETLAYLEARRSVPALVELLFVPIPEVRQAAWSALRALTGQELPAEPQIWEEYAFG